MPSKCPCGKCKCDCKDCNNDSLALDQDKLAWVRANCKFAESPLRPSFTRHDIDEIKDPLVTKPWTPSALETDPDFGDGRNFVRHPEDPQATEAFMTSSKHRISQLLERAQHALSKIGEQMPTYKMDSPFGNYGSGSTLKSLLLEAAEEAKALEMYSHHNRQQTPAESARLGAGSASVKNAAPQNAEPQKRQRHTCPH